jgi:L-fucose mutarotase/ribose pyranase (RbsD/FucU family)
VKGHFLPQFYLRGFLDPFTPSGHQPYLWIYSLAERAWERRAPHNVAFEPDYYATGEAEKQLARFEGLLAPTIRKKVLVQAPLDDEDRFVVATFVAMMMMRVPALHQVIRRALTQLGQMMASNTYQMSMQNPAYFERMKAACVAKTGHDLTAVRPEDLNPEGFKIEAARAPGIGVSFGVVPKVASILSHMGWRFLMTEPGTYFATSDRPVCMLDPTIDPAQWETLGSGGLGYEKVEVTLPITGTLALLAGWNIEGRRYTRVGRATVERINGRTMVGAERLIVAPKPVFPGSDRLTRTPPLVPPQA